MDSDRRPSAHRNWSSEELRVLAAIYFNSSFSIGDDARDECRSIADAIGRTPSSVDRQWRNLDAVVKGKSGFNVGELVRQAATDYLSHPSGSKRLALSICDREGWPLQGLITDGRQEAVTPTTPPSSQAELVDKVREMLYKVDFKVFSSGSQGFYRQGKIRLADGTRYQAQVSAVLIGSKHDLTVGMTTNREDIGFAAGPLVDSIEAKTFRTGRLGYYGQGKVKVGPERFQVSLQAVQIGEK